MGRSSKWHVVHSATHEVIATNLSRAEAVAKVQASGRYIIQPGAKPKPKDGGDQALDQSTV